MYGLKEILKNQAQFVKPSGGMPETQYIQGKLTHYRMTLLEHDGTCFQCRISGEVPMERSQAVERFLQDPEAVHTVQRKLPLLLKSVEIPIRVIPWSTKKVFVLLLQMLAPKLLVHVAASAMPLRVRKHQTFYAANLQGCSVLGMGKKRYK